MAMDVEFRQVEAMLEGPVSRMGKLTTGRLGCHELILAKGGIGKVNAAVATVEMIALHHPDAILSTGVAGGIDASLHVMDVVASHEIVYHDVYCGEGNSFGQVQGLPARFPGNPVLYEAALKLPGVYGGLLCSGDRFINQAEEQQSIKKAFPDGLAVDMESAAIAQVCYLDGVPFLAFRILSDTPGATENHSQQYQDFWGSLAEHSFQTLKTFLETLPESL